MIVGIATTEQVEALSAKLDRVLAELAGLRAAQSTEKLSPAEFAKRNGGVSVCTILRKVKDGSLPSVRVGRRILIPADALKARGPEEIARLASQARQSDALPASLPTEGREPKGGRCRQSRPLEALP